MLNSINISYNKNEKKTKTKNKTVLRRLRPTVVLVLCLNKCMNILTKMFQDLNIDSDMLDANENYFVSTYITGFNSLEMK